MRAWLACALGVLGGCVFGGDDSGGGPFVAVNDIEHQYDIALCEHLVTCHEFPNQTTCLATNVPSNLYIDPADVQGVLAGKIRYNGSQVAACFAQLASSTCNPGDLANRRPIGQCLFNVFTGLGQSGAVCSNNDECASAMCATTCAEGQQQCCPGTCVGDAATPIEPLAIGQHCPFGGQGYDACVVGAYCDGMTSLCTAVKPAGSRCQGTPECADGLQCDVFGTLVCVDAPHVGQPCTSSGRCGDEGLYCGNDQICHYVALAGEPCGTGQVCASYTTCNASMQVCQPYPATGQDCSVTQRCNDVGTYCDGSVCQAPKPNGQSCNSNIDCASQYCETVTTLTCMPRPTCPL